MIKLKDILNEGIKWNTGIRKMGNNPTEKKTSEYFGKCTSLNDFKKMIKGLPKNIKKVNVPIELGDFNPKKKEFRPNDTRGIIGMAEAITKAAKEAGNPVKEYGVNTYYSVFHDEESGTDKVNVHFHYKSSKAFADRMAADKFLD